MAKVYVADDEKNIRDLIASFLRKQDLEVEVFETGDQLLLRFMEEAADVVILDVMMPGTNGIDIAGLLRKRSDVPIILLTARDSDDDFVKGFSAGADDYFTKPFSPLKLSLRVKAILARTPMAQEHSNKDSSDSLSYDELVLSDKERSATYQGKNIKLTNTEFELRQFDSVLHVLFQQPIYIFFCFEDISGVILVTVNVLEKEVGSSSSGA